MRPVPLGGSFKAGWIGIRLLEPSFFIEIISSPSSRSEMYEHVFIDLILSQVSKAN